MMELGSGPSGAIFSEDRKHRYVLWRAFRQNPRMLQFVGLNPSKANADRNDNTITKLINITRSNGYDGFFMTNLFALISTDPKALTGYLHSGRSHLDYVGRENDQMLLKCREKSERIVFCWGAFKEAYEPMIGDLSRAQQVQSMFKDAYCLEHLLKGKPKHPLYCRNNQTIIPW